MLLKPNEVKQRLDELYADAPYDMSEFRLRQPGLSRDEIEELEEDVDVRVGPSLRAVLEKYNLSPLTIGGVTLGSSSGIGNFIFENNVDPLTPWWGIGPRPEDLILIGSSDGFAVLTNVENGEVLAVHHGDNWKTAEVVAQDLELFIRGLATANVNRSVPNIADTVAHDVGAASRLFWPQFASGRT